MHAVVLLVIWEIVDTDTVDYVKGDDEVDSSRMRTTNMKWNRRLLIPKPINYKDFEVKWRNLELLCMEEAKNVKRQLDEKHGKRKFYNINDEEEAGMCSLKWRRENSELVYFETDKSGKMSADTVENFCVKMLPHVDGNKVVDFDVVEKIEDENNL